MSYGGLGPAMLEIWTTTFTSWTDRELRDLVRLVQVELRRRTRRLHEDAARSG